MLGAGSMSEQTPTLCTVVASYATCLGVSSLAQEAVKERVINDTFAQTIGHGSGTPILVEIFKIQNRPQEKKDFYVSSRVRHSFPSIGWARNKPQFHTVLRNLRLLL